MKATLKGPRVIKADHFSGFKIDSPTLQLRHEEEDTDFKQLLTSFAHATRDPPHAQPTPAGPAEEEQPRRRDHGPGEHHTGREGKHGIEGSATLFYMVHCGKALYNNLLWRNWSAEALSKMVIIGNSFKGIEERLLSRILERDYSYIAKVLKGTEEVALPTHPRYLDTFNDTSVHWFPLQKLKDLSPEVWDFMEEPTYEECEIIRKDRADQCGPTAAES
ncbi:PREDICTED: SRR1-like protein [Charadrius vociferus]|uniref:SRR1-like protein n=1 Tax=Charadrius vociferus TaxID=50402 RepID=UPI000521A091|nr:PREDICTED: SRR1-like protein [Charadrius vociferus]